MIKIDTGYVLFEQEKIPDGEVEILANFNINDKNYVATIDRNIDKSDEIFLFEYVFISDDEIELQEIKSYVEYEIALNYFAELCEKDEKEMI
ncbi:MAG: DUF1292 domain-containing protein [Oscillospiraceae bacterium]